MSRFKRAPKSIYERVKTLPEARPLPVLIHGDKMSHQLHGVSERLSNVYMKRVELAVKTLKLSAASVGSYSLSANQLGLPTAIFVMYRDLQPGHWFHPEALKFQEE